MTFHGDWAEAPSTERRRETRAKAGRYARPRKSGRVSKSDAGWKALRTRAEGRKYANRTDAAKGRV
jgi:hypothetical protein